MNTPLPAPAAILTVASPSAPPAAIERLKRRLPEHARDLRINLGAISTATALSPQQAWGTALTAALSARNPEVIAAIEEAGAPLLTAEAVFAAHGAASIMAMNNIYDRFLHTMGEDSEYSQMPARLRMQIISRPGIDALDFDLWCLAASVISGCETSVRAHEKAVRERRGTAEQVHEAVRIASVIHAVAVTLDTAVAGVPGA